MARFGNLTDEESFSEWYLSLYPFSTIRPLTYLDYSALGSTMCLLSKHVSEAFDVLADLDREITHAILSMLRRGSSWGREYSPSLDRPNGLVDFEHIWHPEYQRYCEHIFNHLIRIPLGVLGRLRGKNYLEPTLANRVKILQDNGLWELTRGYNAVIRNAISHGSISFEFQRIRYLDKKSSIELTAQEFAELFDSLADVCHAIVVALVIFLCGNQPEATQRGLGLLPLGFRFLLVDGIASHRDFRILSMIESETVKREKQLNIYCSTSASSRNIHLFESLNVCWNSQRLGGQRYSRFGVSIDCGRSIPASVFLNGQELLRVSQDDLPVESGKDIFETSLLWYDTAKWVTRIHNLKNIFLLSTKLARFQIRAEWRKLGLKVLSSRYFIRHIDNKSVGKVRRLEAQVVLASPELPSREMLLGIIKQSIRKLRRRRIPRIEIGTVGRVKRRPSYVWISLYRVDGRIRSLLHSGWGEGNLLLHAEWISILRSSKPVYVRSPDEVAHNIRIQYDPELRARILSGHNSKA